MSPDSPPDVTTPGIGAESGRSAPGADGLLAVARDAEAVTRDLGRRARRLAREAADLGPDGAGALAATAHYAIQDFLASRRRLDELIASLRALAKAAPKP